jgi:electron transport complex protein RnfD
MATTSPTFTVGAAPHWREDVSLTRLNYAFVLALTPTALLGAVGHAFGEKAAELDASAGLMNQVIQTLAVELGLDSSALWLLGILGTLALGMGLGMFFEYVSQVLMRQPYRATDGHGALMGMLMALLMPPAVPWWVLAIGVAVAVFLGKQIFGGIGGYPMHPAAVGWLVLMLSWPDHVYPVGSASIAAPGAAAVIATLAGGLLLWLKGYIRPQVVLGVLIGTAIFSVLFQGRLPGSFADQFLTGHVILAAFFVATDATSSPANRRAQWIFGFGVGFLIVLIRAFGIWPDAMPFAVLLMNVMNPLLDRLRPRVHVPEGVTR